VTWSSMLIAKTAGCLGTATPRRHLSAIATPRKSEYSHRVYQHSSFFSKYYSEI
jgi:hypothetical protein